MHEVPLWVLSLPIGAAVILFVILPLLQARDLARRDLRELARFAIFLSENGASLDNPKARQRCRLLFGRTPEEILKDAAWAAVHIRPNGGIRPEGAKETWLDYNPAEELAARIG